ncbi:DUF4833 domain-containing protein [Parapedobacter sp. ISTM3]|uniref:DUF4833 domain-containing protein n=1 Tax=Parapedobacter luteus TaxID=623280 RepID=A0A1T5F3S7_9SPHI|nr:MULTISPECIES: DUF4833 domain-containing protein [Parapedobacter]MBK1442189.1 DUF4833 domain-containing protein [Parapedobacter sp. ISTM3]SKB90741.1 protein of unknown function [Parapedobacter luteus]
MLSSLFLKQHTLKNAKQYIWLKSKISIAFLFSALGLIAQENKFEKKVVLENLPVPKEKKQLFYLQRDPDENTVVYQLNMKGNMVDADEPVNVYWIRYAEGGVRKDLNFVQRTMAYGIIHKALDNGDFELRLTAYKNLPLRLSYCSKSKAYVVYAPINNREAILERIFVRINGGSMFKPDIAYFELVGRDTATMAKVTERIKP